ncbi:hypothetical protein RhiirB3_470841 [Rhizophagus irregularis]|nr:hypothetical protein RhiirB3_470841 [Rhizophagus irregularis]
MINFYHVLKQCLATKYGYIRNNMTLYQNGNIPDEHIVRYSPNCFHCIHPEFMRPAAYRVDILFIHNPEYFLMDKIKSSNENVKGMLMVRTEPVRFIGSSARFDDLKYYKKSIESMVHPVHSRTEPNRTEPPMNRLRFESSFRGDTVLRPFLDAFEAKVRYRGSQAVRNYLIEKLNIEELKDENMSIEQVAMDFYLIVGL